MITDFWTFNHPIGYKGKIQLWPMKSRNEDAVTYFWEGLIVHDLTLGIHRFNVEPLGPVASICAIPAN